MQHCCLLKTSNCWQQINAKPGLIDTTTGSHFESTYEHLSRVMLDQLLLRLGPRSVVKSFYFLPGATWPLSPPKGKSRSSLAGTSSLISRPTD
jgi:hypothetical protein